MAERDAAIEKDRETWWSSQTAWLRETDRQERTALTAAFGGEWSVGSVLIAELIRPQHRGKAVGLVQSSWAVGWGVAAMAYSLLFSVAPPEMAWRILFWLGLLPALLTVFIRRYVNESEI